MSSEDDHFAMERMLTESWVAHCKQYSSSEYALSSQALRLLPLASLRFKLIYHTKNLHVSWTLEVTSSGRLSNGSCRGTLLSCGPCQVSLLVHYVIHLNAVIKHLLSLISLCIQRDMP